MLSAEQRVAVRGKIAKAEEFMLVSEFAMELAAYDATVSLAVSAGINASDAIILANGGVPPNASDHQQSARTLRRIDTAAAAQLTRVLNLKHKAQYSLQRCTRANAEDAIRASSRLIEKSKAAHV